ILLFSQATSTTAIYTLSLHDALPILDDQPHHNQRNLVTASADRVKIDYDRATSELDRGLSGINYPYLFPDGKEIPNKIPTVVLRSEEHTSELQSRENLVCRLLLEKKK